MGRHDTGNFPIRLHPPRGSGVGGQQQNPGSRAQQLTSGAEQQSNHFLPGQREVKLGLTKYLINCSIS